MKRLDWDSEFFGIAIARADLDDDLEAAVDDARAQGVDCLYLFAPSAPTDLVTRAVQRGARLVDLRLELELDLAEPPEADEESRVADPAADGAVVEVLAVRLSRFSRFAADPRFPPDRIAEMYRSWARRCLAEGVVVLPAGQPLGLVGARPGAERAAVDLVYVDPQASGRGLGGTLVGAALARLGTGHAVVATSAANLPAVRLYESLGFRSARLAAVLHLWLDDVA